MKRDWEENAALALDHIKEMNSRFSKEIQYSIDNSIFVNVDDVIVTEENPGKDCVIEVLDCTSQGALYNLDESAGKVCILNFADFKKPGGLFLEGSYAQEEALCHASTLYNVLSTFPEYYEYNEGRLNGGIYLHRAIYSPDIVFCFGDKTIKADVLTCAAPNKIRCVRYGQGDEKAFDDAMWERICFIYELAMMKNVDTFILGAWGCGVFCNSPTYVASCFKAVNKVGAGYFNRIIYPIPGATSKNHMIFENIFAKED